MGKNLLIKAHSYLISLFGVIYNLELIVLNISDVITHVTAHNGQFITTTIPALIYLINFNPYIYVNIHAYIQYTCMVIIIIIIVGC